MDMYGLELPVEKKADPRTYMISKDDPPFTRPPKRRAMARRGPRLQTYIHRDHPLLSYARIVQEYDAVQVGGTFHCMFRYGSYKHVVLDAPDDIVSRDLGKNNPCVKFYDCVLLADMPTGEPGEVRRKGTRLSSVEFRSHLLLTLCETEGALGRSSRCGLDLRIGDVTYHEMIGCRGMGRLVEDMELQPDRWSYELEVEKDGKGHAPGRHRFDVHLPDMRMDMDGEPLTTDLVLRTYE